ncbi:hypothetical protein CLSAB_19580 [Clostridium saccharobutylicum]|jgi:hypothetical protein|uniref:hypothetical protein n=1 Tax=Clostridium saccharobutylicum TaxID=169679 RepID=UPI0009D437E0|nr:hypothetical protein [Clostridium saccharobutylicum]OOM17238.1 hypothetical protein CLSAB_19580 [Clostridium saccharobutylicum]
MAKRKIIPISFKNTTKDMLLYSTLKSLEEQSDTIKEILYKALILDKEPKK